MCIRDSTRRLRSLGYANLLVHSRNDLDLASQAEVEHFFAEKRPEYVFLSAARVGGILANSRHPAEFIYENLVIQTNVIDSARRFGCCKLLFLGSSCVYPRLAPQPITEDALMTGPLESTNRAYAVAKIAGIAMCQAYRTQYGFDAICAMPTNLYGPEDNFSAEDSHVLPALIRRFVEAKEKSLRSVSVWGSGRPLREFLHVDDLADACVFLMSSYSSGELINVGAGVDVSIRELTDIIRDVVGYDGEVVFDTSKPDGTPRKVLDISRLSRLGWAPRIGLREGIVNTYKWFLENRDRVRV
jgi:GDP-L-fucose synthase